MISLIGAPAAWMLVLYIGSLLSLFLTSLYRLNEDGSGIVKVIGAQNYRTLARQVCDSGYIAVADGQDRGPGDGRRHRPGVTDRLLHREDGRADAGVVCLVAAVLVPLWAWYLVKAFSWRAIIGSPGGVLDKTFGGSPNYGQAALVIVLAYLWLPFMILPIDPGLERLPDSLLDASSDLGAHFGFTFRKVVLAILVSVDRRRGGVHLFAVVG